MQTHLIGDRSQTTVSAEESYFDKATPLGATVVGSAEKSGVINSDEPYFSTDPLSTQKMQDSNCHRWIAQYTNKNILLCTW